MKPDPDDRLRARMAEVAQAMEDVLRPPAKVGRADPLLVALAAWGLISVRTRRCLTQGPHLFRRRGERGDRSFDMLRLSDVAVLRPAPLWTLRNFGSISLFELTTTMARYGWRLSGPGGQRLADPARHTVREAYHARRAQLQTELRGDKQDENAATIKMRIVCWGGSEGRRA